jgi:hypothetical protein
MRYLVLCGGNWKLCMKGYYLVDFEENGYLGSVEGLGFEED